MHNDKLCLVILIIIFILCIAASITAFITKQWGWLGSWGVLALTAEAMGKTRNGI